MRSARRAARSDTYPPSVRTAQDTYNEMMKASVAPGIRALGFKGSGRNYELPSPRHWAMLGFQRSAFSDATVVRFTINVLVVQRAVWEKTRTEKSHLPPRPTANTFCGTFVWQHRIGDLPPGSEDLWWRVAAGADTDELAAAVLWAVKDYALPAMREQMRV